MLLVPAREDICNLPWQLTAPLQHCRENWGMERATLKLQAFLELTQGRERLRAALKNMDSTGVNVPHG